MVPISTEWTPPLPGDPLAPENIVWSANRVGQIASDEDVLCRAIRRFGDLLRLIAGAGSKPDSSLTSDASALALVLHAAAERMEHCPNTLVPLLRLSHRLGTPSVQGEAEVCPMASELLEDCGLVLLRLISGILRKKQSESIGQEPRQPVDVSAVRDDLYRLIAHRLEDGKKMLAIVMEAHQKGLYPLPKKSGGRRAFGNPDVEAENLRTCFRRWRRKRESRGMTN